MVQERGSLRVLDTLRKRLQDAAGRGATYTGVLYGLHLEGERLVVGAAGKEGGGDLELCNEMLPCGIEPIGVFGFGGEEVGGLEKLASQLPALTQVYCHFLLIWDLENNNIIFREMKKPSCSVLHLLEILRERWWEKRRKWK